MLNLNCDDWMKKYYLLVDKRWLDLSSLPFFQKGKDTSLKRIIDFLEHFDSLDELGEYFKLHNIIDHNPESIRITMCRTNKSGYNYYQDIPCSEYVMGLKCSISSKEVLNQVADMLRNPIFKKELINCFAVYPTDKLWSINPNYYDFLYKAADMFSVICGKAVRSSAYYNYDVDSNFAYSWLENNYVRTFEYKVRLLCFIRKYSLKKRDEINFDAVDYLRPDDPKRYFEEGLEYNDFLKYNPGALPEESRETAEELREYITHRHI